MTVYNNRNEWLIVGILWSYQDGYRLVTVRSLGGLIALLDYDTKPPEFYGYTRWVPTCDSGHPW